MENNKDVFGFEKAIDISKLTKEQLDLLENILKDFK
jgi:hypothetical protein